MTQYYKRELRIHHFKFFTALILSGFIFIELMSSVSAGSDLVFGMHISSKIYGIMFLSLCVALLLTYKFHLGYKEVGVGRGSHGGIF